MGFFSNILRAGINVAIVPVEVVKDVVTMGGVVTGDNHDDNAFFEGTFTGKRLSKALKHVEDACKAID